METDTTTRLRSQCTTSWRGHDDTTSVQRGTTLGRYTVLEAVGSGGMGNVYAAWDPELRRRVAIKVLHGALLQSAGQRRARARLRSEAQAAARLAHPNVVAIYDVGTVGDRLFIAMELVEGQTLKTWLAKARPWQEVLDIYRHAGRGLAAAHRAGLIHRDFKPSNVMLSTDGQVKILDFGLAKAIRGDGGGTSALEPAGDRVSRWTAVWDASLGDGATGSATATRSGQILGTPHYMSPEQVGGRAIDHRSDQFSFCVSLYQSLYGDLPFERGSVVDGSRHDLSRAVSPPPPNAEVPPRIHAVLERGLRADPDARHPSMDDLLDDFDVEAATGWRLKLAVALVVAAGLAVAFGMGPRAIACEASGAQLDAVWGADRQRSLQQVFASLDASAQWPQVASTMDRRIVELRSMYGEACEATHVRGEQSYELLDRRTACLDDRQRSIDSLLRLFEQGRPEVVARALESVGGLASAAACADRQALADLAPSPPTDASRAAVIAVRERLADAFALELAGRYDEAFPLAQAALADAEVAGYRPLVGEAQLQHARLVGRLGDSEAMKASLIDAASTALATHHRALLAQAYSQLIIVGFLQGETDDGRAFGRMAASVISTLSGRDDLEAERLFFEGMIFLREGRFVEAKRQYERYLSIPDELSPLEEVTALNNYAEAMLGLGEFEPARQALLRAEGLLDRLSLRHQLRPILLGNLGQISLALGELEQAEGYILRCVALAEASLGAQHPQLANYLLLLARLDVETRRFDHAVEVLQRATAIHQAMPGYENKPVERQWLLGRALWEQGRDRDTALRWIRQAASAVDPVGEQATVADAAEWLRVQGRD